MHGSTMYERLFGDMSVRELWTLYEQVESILARRLLAKKQELEARLERLRPKDPLDSSQIEDASENESSEE